MNRTIRDRLVGLLLGAFRDPVKRDAILWSALYWELCPGEHRPCVLVSRLEGAWAAHYPEFAGRPRRVAEAAAGLEGILDVHECPEAPGRGGQAAGSRNPGGSWCEPHADALPFLADVRGRVRTYAEVVREGAARATALAQMEPLRRGVAEAAICFNAGLFFEAHEHLEGHWRGLPPTSAKRFVQGIIQISVGFHHAMRGSYQGAVNQLGKGLAKLAEAPEGALGLERDRFAADVEAARQAIVSRGRDGMRRASLQELPRMYLRY